METQIDQLTSSNDIGKLSSQFLIRPDITYLNFGSFGACAKPIFECYQQFQLELEREPVQFIAANGPQYLKTSRKVLGEYINANEDDLVYVTNPTYGTNIIAKNFPLKAGDEILTTNIEYGACDRTWEFYCKKAGAVYKRQLIRFPIESKEDFVRQFLSGLTERTKLIFISHITSSTALRLPAEEICAAAKEKGLPVFIDGAHAPGQTPIDLQALNVDFYTGACHKWMLAPKGCSFLYVKKQWQNMLEPLVVSWGYNALFPSGSQFLDYHQMVGTRDFSAFLTVPKAIEFMEENNWKEVAAHYRKLTQENAGELCTILKAIPIAPVNDNFTLQMYSAEIKTSQPEKLHQYFFDEYSIEIPVMRQNNKVYLRYSLNAFNSQSDMNKLFDAIRQIKQNTNLIES